MDGGDDRLDHEPVTYENTSILNATDRSGKLRYSDSHAINEYSNIDVSATSTAQRTAQRKYHSKSFSLSENRVAANLNVFKQNRELWEKRTEMQSTHSLTAPRILTRNRIAPDLVMDLPVSNKDRVVNRSRESLDSSDEATVDAGKVQAKINNGSAGGSADGNEGVANSKSVEDMTSAERFATQNQCTLKKNERFSAGASSNPDNGELHKENVIDGKASGGSNSVAPVLGNRAVGPAEKPKAEIKPQESTLLKELNRTSDPKVDGSVANAPALIAKEVATTKDLQHKSPIPSRNTQKFVSQFADLKLTGGCLSNTSNTTPINTVTDAKQQPQQQQQQSASLSSFKPQVKVKPQILRKPLVLPPTTPETVRRNQD